MDVTYLLKKYPDKPWNWSKLSENKHITIKDVLNNPDKPWDWSRLSENKNITIEFIEKNINKIDFSCLSSNTFIDKEPFLELLNKYLPRELNLIIIEYLFHVICKSRYNLQ